MKCVGTYLHKDFHIFSAEMYKTINHFDMYNLQRDTT